MPRKIDNQPSEGSRPLFQLTGNEFADFARAFQGVTIDLKAQKEYARALVKREHPELGENFNIKYISPLNAFYEKFGLGKYEDKIPAARAKMNDFVNNRYNRQDAIDAIAANFRNDYKAYLPYLNSLSDDELKDICLNKIMVSSNDNEIIRFQNTGPHYEITINAAAFNAKEGNGINENKNFLKGRLNFAARNRGDGRVMIYSRNVLPRKQDIVMYDYVEANNLPMIERNDEEAQNRTIIEAAAYNLKSDYGRKINLIGADEIEKAFAAVERPSRIKGGAEVQKWLRANGRSAVNNDIFHSMEGGIFEENGDIAEFVKHRKGLKKEQNSDEKLRAEILKMLDGEVTQIDQQTLQRARSALKNMDNKTLLDYHAYLSMQDDEKDYPALMEGLLSNEMIEKTYLNKNPTPLASPSSKNLHNNNATINNTMQNPTKTQKQMVEEIIKKLPELNNDKEWVRIQGSILLERPSNNQAIAAQISNLYKNINNLTTGGVEELTLNIKQAWKAKEEPANPHTTQITKAPEQSRASAASQPNNKSVETAPRNDNVGTILSFYKEITNTPKLPNEFTTYLNTFDNDKLGKIRDVMSNPNISNDVLCKTLQSGFNKWYIENSQNQTTTFTQSPSQTNGIAPEGQTTINVQNLKNPSEKRGATSYVSDKPDVAPTTQQRPKSPNHSQTQGGQSYNGIG